MENSLRSLFDAVKSGSMEDIKSCIAAGVDLNERDEAGWTPLMYALKYRDKEIAEVLFVAGASGGSGDWMIAAKAKAEDMTKAKVAKVDALIESGRFEEAVSTVHDQLTGEK